MQRTVTDRERRAGLLHKLIAISTALEQLELHDEPAPGDPALFETLVERLTDRLLCNNRWHGRLLHLLSCEPEAMSDAERKAAAVFDAPFLALAAPLIASADELRAASDVFRCETVGRTSADWAIAYANLHEALARTVAALAALIGALVGGDARLPAFLAADALAAAEVEHVVASALRFTSPPPGAV